METREKTALNLLHDKIDAEGFDSLTPSERWFFAICWFIRETNGNAIHGYFFNFGGNFCRDALRGLETVGAVRTADILRRSMAVFPGSNVPEGNAIRQGVLCDLPEEVQWGTLSRLTDELFAEEEDVAELVKAYVSAHPKEFPTFRFKIERELARKS